MSSSKRAIALYLPVLHNGYLEFLTNNRKDVEQVFLLDRSITHVHRSFQKDLRALPLEIAAVSVDILGLFPLPTSTVGREDAESKLFGFDEILMPNEDICREVQQMLSFGKRVRILESFLRWDSSNATAHKEVSSAIEVEPDDDMLVTIKLCLNEAGKSADLWRQVSAAVFKRGEFCFIAHNEIVPSIYTLFYEGDPRGQFKKGINLDLSLANHAEAALVALAAKCDGIGLLGADMFVTDFPCPPCAKLIAFSGIRRLYFLKGYAVLDGERILRDNSVEIFKIKNA